VTVLIRLAAVGAAFGLFALVATASGFYHAGCTARDWWQA
jgi:hypothetical protein